MKSNTEIEQLDLELDKWFKELESQVDENEVARLSQVVADRLDNIPMNNSWDNVANTYEGVFNDIKDRDTTIRSRFG